jgi:glutaredoxin
MKPPLTSTLKKKKKKSQQKSKTKKHLLRSLFKKKGDGRKSKGSTKFKFKPVWEVYTLEGCPYCEKAVNLLNKNKQIVKVKEFAKLTPKQKEVVNKRQGRDFQTFPRIFNKEFVGGFTDLEKLFPSKGYIF